MGIHNTPLQKFYEISVGSQYFAVKFTAAVRYIDSLDDL